MGMPLHLARIEPPSVLLIENEPLISLDLCNTLVEAGYQVIGPANTVAGALFLLRQHKPDFAILDILLSDGPCTEVARQLQRLHILFLIYSGYGRHSVEIDGFSDVPWLAKPAQPSEIIGSIDAMLGHATEDPFSTTRVDEHIAGSRISYPRDDPSNRVNWVRTAS